MSSDVVLKVDSVCKHYRAWESPHERLKELLFGVDAASQVEVVKNISLELGRGQILGVIGPNGAGKSTLLQMIAGTLRPSSGSISIDGRLTALLELGAGVDPELTGIENIYLMSSTYGIPRAQIKTGIDDIIRFSGLGRYIDKPVKTYSSGMFVRLAFSVSTALEPDVLIVDEALSVGDVGFQAKCLERLEELIASGTSILLASHDMQLIRNYCTSAICLHQGEIIARGEPELVTERYLHLMRQDREDAQETLSWKVEQEAKARFASREGEITSVEVLGADQNLNFKTGARVQVRVECELHGDKLSPAIILILRDARGYNIYGLKAREAQLQQTDTHKVSACFEMPLHLAEGSYSFTVRLENTKTDTINYLLDKHVGICSFTVNDPDKAFLGGVNLHGKVVTGG
jgi:lipopolysaccharide transport system ATP-binding protein